MGGPGAMQMSAQRKREHLEPLPDVPTWIGLGSSLFVIGSLIYAAFMGASTLPPYVQAALFIFAALPWVPFVPQKFVSPAVISAGLIPPLVVTWTGGSPWLFALVAMTVGRVSISTTIPKTIAITVPAIGIIVGRYFIADLPTDWWMWKTYVELAAVVGIAWQRQNMLMYQIKESSAEHAQLAALEERRRIARDVHDVLAHTLTILMVHLNSARLSVIDDPEGTAEILDEVSAQGRKALDEIRRTVGLLSERSSPQPAGPVEWAAAIEDLVASYRNAGIDVELRLDVEMAQLKLLSQVSPSLGKVGYRIVQESLANATKHAPGARIHVRIFVDDDGLHLRCANAVRPGVVMLELPRGGNGVTGMEERVAAVGGRFSAGVENGEWLVRADLPFAEAAPQRAAESVGRAS